MAAAPSGEEPQEIREPGQTPRARLIDAARQVVTILRGRDAHSRAQATALIAFAIRIVSAAIAFLSQIVMARMMGNFEYGIFVFIWVFVILAGNLSCLGFHAAQIRFLPQYEAREMRAEIRGLAVTARVFSVLSASTVAVIGFIAVEIFRQNVPDYDVLPLFIGFLILPMVALGDTMEGTARAHSWGIAALSPTYLIRPLLILAFTAIAVQQGAEPTAVTAMKASLVATYLTTILQLVNISWRLNRHHDKGPMRIEFVQWLKVAFPLFLVEGFLFLLTNADVVVVGIFLPPSDVAVYFAAAKTMAIIQFVYFSVKAASAPRFSAMMAGHDQPGLARFAGQTVRWVFWPSLGVGLLVLAAGPWLLGAFGPGFESGHVLMAILFAGIMAKAAIGPGEVLLSMAGHQNLCVRIYAVVLTVAIILYLLLIPAYGLTGAAFATAGAMWTEAILLHLFVRRKLGLTMFALIDPLGGKSRLKDA